MKVAVVGQTRSPVPGSVNFDNTLLNMLQHSFDVQHNSREGLVTIC